MAMSSQASIVAGDEGPPKKATVDRLAMSSQEIRAIRIVNGAAFVSVALRPVSPPPFSGSIATIGSKTGQPTLAVRRLLVGSVRPVEDEIVQATPIVPLLHHEDTSHLEPSSWS
jgi:hypothetical protein